MFYFQCTSFSRERSRQENLVSVHGGIQMTDLGVLYWEGRSSCRRDQPMPPSVEYSRTTLPALRASPSCWAGRQPPPDPLPTTNMNWMMSKSSAFRSSVSNWRTPGCMARRTWLKNISYSTYLSILISNIWS